MAQESVREMAERYTALQEKFRCVCVFMASYVPSQHTNIGTLLYRDHTLDSLPPPLVRAGASGCVLL